MLYLMNLFNKSPALLAICLLLGLTLPLPALARIPDQVEIKQADALLSDIEECAIDSLVNSQDKWSCIETKYDELLRMHLEDVNPSAHWCAAYSSWKRGDIALTYKRLNLIKAEFPTYENKKIRAEFTSLKSWLDHLDLYYAPVKLRVPWFGEAVLLEGQTSSAQAFANWQLNTARSFKGYLFIGQYTFGDEILVVTADGYTLSQPKEAEEAPAVASGPGKLTIVYPVKVPRTYPSGRKVEWKPDDYTVVRWTSEADCEANGANFQWRYDMHNSVADKPIVQDAIPAGTYWMATYLKFKFDEYLRQEAKCQPVVIGVGLETTFTPEITSTLPMVERQRHPPTQDFLDGMVLAGPGLRFDAPNSLGVVGPSLVLEGRFTPSWWLNADPGWTAGYQVLLDYRNFGGAPALSWGAGGTVGRDWNVPAKAGMVTVSVDGGIMLGTGAFGAPCSFNPAAARLDEVGMVCGGSRLAFPRLVPASYMELPGSFYGFYGGLTGRAMVRWNVKNSGWFLGGGAWGMGQVFLVAGNQMDHQAAVVLSDGSSVEVPYRWGSSVFLRGQMVPGIVIGGRFP